MMTIKNKILAILLAVSFNAFAAAWTGSTSEPENMKKIDGKAFYVITTADELAWFAAQVNAGQTTINAVLGNDILFGASTSKRSSQRWIPIGKDSSHIFNGILDGAGKTIYGLFVTNEKYVGLVGILGKSGIVRNLNIQSGKRTFVSYEPQIVAGLVALNHGMVNKCTNGDTITFNVEYNDFYGDFCPKIGGVVGQNQGNIEYGVNNGLFNVTIKKIFCIWLGGIAGTNRGNILNSENKALIKYTGTYTTQQSDFIGGVVGSNNGMTNLCKNTGEIQVSGHGQYVSTGGIAGENSKTLKNSINYASISVKIGTSNPWQYSGGIVGENSAKGSIVNCINVGSSLVTTNASKDGYIGGTVGLNRKSATVENIFYDASLLTKRNPVGLDSGTTKNTSGMTTANMQKDQFAWILNTTNGTASNSGVWSRNGGYPIFTDESNRAIYKIVFNDDGVTSNRYNTNKGTVSFPEDPEPAEGYIFTGWYNSSDIRVKPTTVFSADQTVNAVYVDASNVFWTINFYNTDAKSTLLETKSYQHGSVVAYNGETPTKETTAQYTYSFKGWDAEITNAVEDFDYHAVYDSTVRSYKISFNNFDGTLIENATFEYGKMPSCSKAPSRVATAEWKYSHKGWKPALDYVTGEASYIATYDSSKVEYKVTFLNGTTVIDEQMIPYGGAAAAPTNVTRDGYKFVGWNTTFSNVTENLTVKALFEELITYIVKVDGPNGEKIDSAKIEENGTYVLPTAPKKGWLYF